MALEDHYPLLSRINYPSDLRQLDENQLVPLAEELRRYLIETVSSCGGHFSAGLGTVELTIALHYVFNTPNDRLVWDVGHQSYPHKVLTGRRDLLGTIRKKDGLTPFPKRSESEFDDFGVGHSSTSIGAALGMTVADATQGLTRKAIAIIGDGAMTAGMAFEALNHCGDIQADLLTVLNDNEMSISPNVGALSKYLTRILSGPTYSSMREGSKKVLEKMPPMWEIARRAEEHMKGMVAPGTLFEELGIHYFGPIDGHDLPTLVKTLRNLKDHKGPRLLHIITKKGKG
jgi:1-deoxy-D-xylulose-5-phosphate synthase